jgi:phospholipid-binding lipoprotein MlaA
MASGHVYAQAGGNSNGNNDSLEPGNRVVYDFNDKLDRYVLKPVAEKYVDYTPKIVRTGVGNFFDNLLYLDVILNDFLQGKMTQGISDVGRFVVNSTFGIGGLIDIASAYKVPKHNEDFGQTLGAWGLEEGAYLVLPIKGPNSLRDAPDLATSTLLNPLFYITSPVVIPAAVLGGINERARFLEATRVRDEAALDSYTFTREAYRQKRLNDIHDGNPPTQGLDEFIEGEEENGALIID